MNLDILDKIMKFLPLEDIVRNVSIVSKLMYDVAHFYKSIEIYDLSHIKDLDAVSKITND